MEFRARAPGKIILAGEHAVVHGSTAVAAAIDLYTHALFRNPISENCQGAVELELKDMNLLFSWLPERLKEMLGEFVTPIPLSPRVCKHECLKLITNLVEEQNVPEAKIWLSSGISAFLYLYISIHGYKAGRIVVTSELPLGAGLGSSASLCVSIAAALLGASGAFDLDNEQQDWSGLMETEFELVNKWAFEGEKIIHGKPSGIDNTVITYGSMIKFRSGELSRLKSTVPIKMLITNTKVGRNTKALVASVSERALRHPEAMTAVFTAVDSISKELSAIIESPVSDDITVTSNEEKIEELMEMNQGLLQSMGVSHSSIETVLRTTLKYKLASKLTGAGGGGCVLTLLPRLLSSNIVDKVISELEACGFQCFRAEVGGNGLEVCHS